MTIARDISDKNIKFPNQMMNMIKTRFLIKIRSDEARVKALS